MRDLLWLVGATARNRARWMAKQLKRPRYLVTAALGVGYFAFIFLAPLLGSEPDTDRARPDWVLHVAPFAVAAWLVFAWVRGGYEDALAFTASETHFLFPAPLGRPTLIRYKLLRAQLGIGLTVLLAWFFTFGGPVPWYLTLVGYWMSINTLYLHQLGASLTRVTAMHDGGGLRRVAVPVAVAVLVLGAVAWSFAGVVGELRSAPDLATAITGMVASLDRPVSRVALYPFRAMVGPVLAGSTAEWLAAVPAALLFLALHYAWVMRTDAAFEEAAAEAGEKRARIQARLRSGQSIWQAGKEDTRARRWIRPPLAPVGEPTMALVWKHVLKFTGAIGRSTVVVVVGGAAAVFALLVWASGSVPEAATGMVMIFALSAGMALLFGPIGTRTDLRADLASLQVLRTYPLDPRWVVAAEVGSAAFLISAIQVLLLLAALAFLPLTSLDDTAWRVAGLLALAIMLAPAITGLVVVIQNAIALMFPEWSRIGGTNPGGFDHMGRMMLTFVGTTLALAALLLPPILATALLHASFATVLHGWAAVPSGAALVGALWIEVALLVRWLARRYAALDPGEAGLLT